MDYVREVLQQWESPGGSDSGGAAGASFPVQVLNKPKLHVVMQVPHKHSQSIHPCSDSLHPPPPVQVIYLICKTRGYKHVVKLFPHEVSDLEPAVRLVVSQDRDAHEYLSTPPPTLTHTERYPSPSLPPFAGHGRRAMCSFCGSPSLCWCPLTSTQSTRPSLQSLQLTMMPLPQLQPRHSPTPQLAQLARLALQPPVSFNQSSPLPHPTSAILAQSAMPLLCAYLAC